jgi:hypothetical protein
MPRNWSRSPKVSAFSRLRRDIRPAVETLENRQLLSTVDWISPSSGSWDVASNWSTDAVPGSGDNVVINVPGVTVTISSKVESVNSVTIDDPLDIAGGGLTVGWLRRDHRHRRIRLDRWRPQRDGQPNRGQ